MWSTLPRFPKGTLITGWSVRLAADPHQREREIFELHGSVREPLGPIIRASLKLRIATLSTSGHTGNGSRPSRMTKPSMRCVRMWGLTMACEGRPSGFPGRLAGGSLLVLLTAEERRGGGGLLACVGSSGDRITDLLDWMHGWSGSAMDRGGGGVRLELSRRVYQLIKVQSTCTVFWLSCYIMWLVRWGLWWRGGRTDVLRTHVFDILQQIHASTFLQQWCRLPNFIISIRIAIIYIYMNSLPKNIVIIYLSSVFFQTHVIFFLPWNTTGTVLITSTFFFH